MGISETESLLLWGYLKGRVLNPAGHILESPCQGLWPLRSPDLTPPDYFLWGYFKYPHKEEFTLMGIHERESLLLWGYMKGRVYSYGDI